MLIRSGVKFELNPSAEQRSILASYAGTSRFVWNWGLARKQEHYQEVVIPAKEAGNPVGGLSSVDLINEWTRVKDAVAPWNRETPAQIAIQSLMDLGMAYNRFFDGRKQGRKVGFPKFKARGHCAERFRFPGDATRYDKEGNPHLGRVKIERRGIAIPRLGLVPIKNDPTDRLVGTRITSVTISCSAGRWYASCAVVREIVDPVHIADKGSVLGIDLGLKTFAVCSDGREIIAPEPLNKSLSDLRKLNRDISRQRNVRDGVKTARMRKREAHQAHQAGLAYWPTKAEKKARKVESKARREAVKAAKTTQLQALVAEARAAGQPIPTKLPHIVERKSHRLIAREGHLARLHRTIANRRANFIQEITTRLVRRAHKTHGTIAIENLRVSNLVRNHRLARRIADQGWGEFRRQLEYKSLWAGTGLYIAPTFYASSKICSRCGEIKSDLTLDDRVYVCGRCGLVIDRDLNAARNLRKQAVMAIARGESLRPRIPGQDSLSRKLTPVRKRSSKSSPLKGKVQILSVAAQANLS